MDAHALTIKTVRDGAGCTLILRGDLDLPATGRFLEQAALAVDDWTGWLGFDLAGVLFLDCAGVRALRIATRLAPGSCPVITG
jgi:anti-anti-sigma regulatory factor